MKQNNLLTRMLLLCALIVGSTSAWAETVTFTAGTDTSDSKSITKDGITITFSDGVFNRTDNYRCYSGASMTISSTVGNITQIDFTATSSNPMTKFSGNPNVGAWTNSDTKTQWTGNASEVNFGTTSGQCRMTEIVVTYTPNGGSQSTTWSVTYNANGATSGDVPTDDTEYDTDNNTVNVLGNTGNLAKDHYTFAGWNTKADGTGTGYVANNTFTISANTTLYAQWAVNTNTVTLPVADEYGSYTMDKTNPVAYGTEVTLTYTPATGYENYAATWSVNGSTISGSKFDMPDDDVTVTVSLEKDTSISMTIDFESATSAYTDWTFTNMTSQQTNSGVSAHGGSYFGSTGGKETASTQTKAKIANPLSLTCYVSKQSTNTTSSTWYIQVSSDGLAWTDAETRSATDMNKGEWKEFTADLSSYSNVYVRVYYSGSTAVRNIDDLTLTVGDTGETTIMTTAEVNLTAEETSGEIAYTINNPVDGTSLTAASTDDWISDVTVDAENSKVTFSATENSGAARTGTITLSYGSLTKDVTINQAKKVITTTYTLATSVVPGRHYIIATGTDGDIKAMSTNRGNNRAATDVTASSNNITASSDLEICEILVGFDNGYYTLYDVTNEKYIYASSNSSNQMSLQDNVDDAARWTITIDDNNVATIKSQRASGPNWIRYNSGNTPPIFSCYTSGQKDIYLYEKVGDTGTQDFTVSINSACTDGSKYYGTFSAPFAFTVPSDVTVSEIGVIDDELLVEEYKAGDVIPANTGVMIASATAGDKTFTSAKGGTSVLGDDNNLRPTIWGVEADDMTAADANSLYYRLTMHNGSQIGFWWGAEDGAAFDYDVANRAYLAVPNSASGARIGFTFGGEATGISATLMNNEKVNSEVYNLNGQRVAQPTKGLYIVNGRKVVVK